MIRTLIKHYIYETCLSIYFDELNKNIADYSDLIPVVGEKFSRIIDNFTGDTFIECIVIHYSDLGYWSDLDIDECNDFAFAIRFKTWLDSNGDLVSMDDYDGFDELHFSKKNLITLACIK